MASRVLKTKDVQITQHYGNAHTGVDVVGKGGTTDMVVAHSSGKVIFCQRGQQNNKGAKGNLSYGNCVKIRHDNGMYTLYAHLADVRVNINQYVSQGQDLGMMGNTGNSYGNHLHFEVFNSSNARVNPEKYLNSNLDGSVECTGTIIYQVYANRKWYDEVFKADDTANGYAGNGRNYISGLRAKPQYGEIFIQVHSIKSGWLGIITSRDYIKNDTQNGNTYAGIYNEPIDKVRIKCTKGWVDFRVLTESGWQSWTRGAKDFGEAGIDGKPILGIQMM